MEQILLASGLSKKKNKKKKQTITVIWMLNKDIKVIVQSPDGDTDSFDIVAGLLHRDIGTISLHSLPQLCTMNVNIFNEKNGFTFKKKKKKRLQEANSVKKKILLMQAM